MKEVSLEVKDVHIVYKMMQKFSIQRNLIKRDAEKAQVFEAVRGITFTAEKGEIIGIIGKNGSGKSTLLRAIAGVFSPNEGTINLNGNSVSLLSLGVGFKDSLTGRENIYLSGMLLGFTEKEIKRKRAGHRGFRRDRRVHRQTGKDLFKWYAFQIDIRNNVMSGNRYHAGR